MTLPPLRRLTDIAPDGVTIVVDWEKFTPGASVFIPTMRYRDTLKHVLRAANLEPKDIEFRVRVEDGKYGVRIWRLIRRPDP
jgi:hypothetical protein